MRDVAQFALYDGNLSSLHRNRRTSIVYDVNSNTQDDMTTKRPLLRRAGMAAGAAILLALAGACGTTIRGVVRDKPTGNPLSAASVAVGDCSATTNAIGAYELRCDVEPKSILLVNAPGYFMYSASVARSKGDGDELIRDVELVPRSQMAPRQ